METEIDSNQHAVTEVATESNIQSEQNALLSAPLDTEKNTKGDGEMQNVPSKDESTLEKCGATKTEEATKEVVTDMQEESELQPESATSTSSINKLKGDGEIQKVPNNDESTLEKCATTITEKASNEVVTDMHVESELQPESVISTSSIIELNRETITEGSCGRPTSKEVVVIESVIQLLPSINEANSSSATSVVAETGIGPSNDLVIAADADIIEIMDVTQAEMVNKSTEAQLVNDKSLSSQVITAEVSPIKGAQSSLGLLSQYGSDVDEGDSSESETESVVEVRTDANKNYRSQVVEIDSDSSETISSASESETEYLSKIAKVIKKRIGTNNDENDDADDDDDYSEGDGKDNKKGGRRQPPRVRGEMLLDDLPPIQDLQISVPAEECTELGRVHSIVDQLLLVSALPNSILLDLDTVLFLDKGKRVLGEVFDVLGQVADPIYCVRFNTNQDIHKKNINIGDVVYVAPKTEYTQYVILSSLMKMRGSDASWENDIEPPPRYLDYSDDEEEREARQQLRKNRRQSTKEDDGKDDDDDDDDKDNYPMKRGRNLSESVSAAEMQQRNERPSSSRRSAQTGIYQKRHERFAPRPYAPHSYQPHHSTSSWHSHYNQQYQPRPPSHGYRSPYSGPFQYQRPLYCTPPSRPPQFNPYVHPPMPIATPQGPLLPPMGHSMPPPQMTPPSPTVYVPNPLAFQTPTQMEQPSRIQPPNANQNVAEPAPPGAD
ncbi:H/ACA ribonucleoprotein complex non-core subunit NAF1 isoform X2 [Anastrepha obliqua]|uniref:H/ACA ribonucleoprotein complex non-core subunit NAF1 isoform X2 n=1 Tax=Anastrepha obliqua TaxID=95512 RepID=UPI0024092CE7|nr:H/ACA ribonucleoprotein complex non-core subunit NAF1 isoform X2 [Anastrepha obliqua]